MNKKDIEKAVWARAFDNLDENGDPVQQTRQIKSDRVVNATAGMRRRAKDPVFLANSKAAAERRAADPKWIEANKANRDQHYKNPQFLAKMKAEGERKAADPDWVAKNKAAALRRAEDPNWIAKMTNIAQTRAAKPGHKEKLMSERWKPCVTPYGIFSSRKELYQYARELGMTNQENKLRPLFKTNPSEYYQISQEEYIMLTGHDPFGEIE